MIVMKIIFSYVVHGFWSCSRVICEKVKLGIEMAFPCQLFAQSQMPSCSLHRRSAIAADEVQRKASRCRAISLVRQTSILRLKNVPTGPKAYYYPQNKLSLCGRPIALRRGRLKKKKKGKKNLWSCALSMVLEYKDTDYKKLSLCILVFKCSHRQKISRLKNIYI